VDPLSPEDLTRWCQRTLPHDTRAFQQLVTTYKLRVFRTAYRMTGNNADAEEIAQDVFLKVYQNIHSLDDLATLTAWIYRITVNVCLNELRRRKRRPNSVPLTPTNGNDNDDASLIDSVNATPEEEALRRELHRCIEAVLRQLNAVERAVVVVAVLTLSTLGVETAVLITSITVLLAAFGLALGLALGLGARPIAYQILAGFYMRQRFVEGQTIVVQEIRGEVSSVGGTNTVVTTATGIVVIPNSIVFESIVASPQGSAPGAPEKPSQPASG
jgi:RNA polymerase sigma factor (sigma-70 family)